jgi:hypothetical protein
MGIYLFTCLHSLYRAQPSYVRIIWGVTRSPVNLAMQNVVCKNPRTTKPHLLLAHTRLPWTCLRVCRPYAGGGRSVKKPTVNMHLQQFPKHILILLIMKNFILLVLRMSCQTTNETIPKIHNFILKFHNVKFYFISVVVYEIK